MIVVDTNVIAYLYLHSAHSDLSEKALVKDPQWAAPLLWRSELRSVLTKYLRNRIISLGVAQQIMEEAENRMRDGEYEVSSLQVLSLASLSACSAYDCEFVALAQALNRPLVTVDRQIITQFPAIAISLEDFTAG
jgi:predicted nucleic acid-binding protein